MSMSKEKKARKRAEERRRRRQTVTLAVIGAALIVILIALAVFVNSKATRRRATAVTVGDMKFTVAEFDYFYYSAYSRYVTDIYANHPSYAESLLPDQSKPLKSQTFSESTGQTWDEVFVEEAMNTIRSVAAAWQAGHEAGYQLSEERTEQIRQTYEAAQAQAESGQMNLDDFLARNFGKAITGEIYFDLLTKEAYAEEYRQSVRDSFTYTPEELAAYYQENRDALDVFAIRSFYLAASGFDDGADGAKAAAEAYAAGIRSEQDMIDAARDFDAASFEEDGSTLHYYAGSAVASYYRAWVTDPARQRGDVTVAENGDSGCYVVYYLERIDNRYPTARLHMITMYADAVNAEDYETTEEYRTARTTARKDLEAEGREVLSQWNEGGGSLDAFEILYKDHTDDYYYVNGLVEDYYRHLYPEEMDAWVYDEARQEGDGAIFTDGDGQACYFVRFGSLGEDYCDYLARTGLSQVRYVEWDASISEGMTVKKGALFSLRG